VTLRAGHRTALTALGRGRQRKLHQDPALAFPARVPLAAALGDVMRRHRVPADRIADLTGYLRLDAALLQRRPSQVSGGELQRLAMARALLLEPALVFADDPTSRLNLITQEETMDCLITELNRRECALLLVTHDHALADAVADTQLSLESPVGQSEAARTHR
jgi:peptide/nickel transport system ATP-binding protein